MYMKSTIGQAHLLDSIIDNLELELADGLPAGKPSYYARRTLTYGLGENVRELPTLNFQMKSSLTMFRSSTSLARTLPAALVSNGRVVRKE